MSERDQMRRDGPLLRSNFIDAFARIEIVVIGFLQQAELKYCSTAPFGQKLAVLHTSRDRFLKPAMIDKWLVRIGGLAAIRADLVHSVLEVAQVRDGDVTRWLYMFRNSGDHERAALLMSAETMRKTIGEMKTIAHQFNQQQLKAPTPTAPASSTE